jgi:ATP-dependent helicase/nuclease subunit A
MMNGLAGMTDAPPPKLAGNQLAASNPKSLIRLSASAGTGKTQVLTARVQRLLLSGADPASILCLTFTKAGAAEMQERIHSTLGRWVTMKGPLLAAELEAIGEKPGPNRLHEARQLFAKVLDARGSGLRIQTIHSFSQSLLAAFPEEAGLPPGFRAVEGREEEHLSAQALANLVDGYEREGRAAALDRLKTVVMRLGEDGTRQLLRRAAPKKDALDALPAGEGLDAFVRRNLAGVDNIAGALERGCGDDELPKHALADLIADELDWGTDTGKKRVAKAQEWLALSPAKRAEQVAGFFYIWATKKDELDKRSSKSDRYSSSGSAVLKWALPLLELAKAIPLAHQFAAALHLSRDYARAYADAKCTANVVDFNDLIRTTVRLLKEPGIGDWVRFKLDQSIDHVLIDEAQDTNADQWSIVESLVGDFFSGEGAAKDRHRTIFLVGDFKQAIFRFQGTNPQEFEAATARLAKSARQIDRVLETLALDQNWRSSQPVLDLTNQLLADLQHETLGLPEPAKAHIAGNKDRSGSITLLPPEIGLIESDDEDEDDALGDAELAWASSLARQVRDWTSGGLRLRNQDRDAEPGDVMILLRNRGAMARLIVSQLHQHGVPVSGVDRLRLGAPIAVQDLLACMRFVLQPEDSLSLASLLVSPLVGWSQPELYERAKKRTKPLWQHLGVHKPPALQAMLDRADLTTPYEFLEFILSDPEIAGRRKLLERLGEEARDPIDALLAEALAFEQQATPSLQQFLDWFDRGEVDIKRDAAKPENAVRVMTVHGSKGLQAPVVVLADATFDADGRKSTDLDWQTKDTPNLPLFRPRKDERFGSVASSAERSDRLDREEHWRLLYVAITRAEEHLVIGGAIKPKRAKSGLGDDCWHTRLSIAMAGIEAEQEDDGTLRLTCESPEVPAKRTLDTIERWDKALPDWAELPAPEEARPPRPLAPSKILPQDDEASPPPDPARRKAAERGIILHGLFERLPALASDVRRECGDRWLAGSCGIADEAERSALLTQTLAIIEDNRFADLFADDALAEVPLSGVVNGLVIAGTVDRLRVTEDAVLVVDYKTGRRVPRDAEHASPHHLAQMAAYAAVLQGIYPAKRIEAALLYTSGPKLITLSAALLDSKKPGFTPQQP